MLQKIDTAITEAFKIDIFKVQQMVKGYQTLTLEPEDEESYKICRTALTSCIRTRTGIDKRRLKLNKDDQDKIKARNAAAKQLTAIVEPAESHLTALVKGEDARKEAIEAEEAEKESQRMQERMYALAKVDCIMTFIEIATMTDEEFNDLYMGKTLEFEERQQVKAEEEAKENERKKLEEIRLAEERMKQAEIEAQQKAEAERLEKIKADLDAQAKAIQDEKNRIAREEADKQAAENAKIQAAKDAEDLAKHQAKEAAEAEEKKKAEAERQEMLKPDKEKIDGWFGKIIDVIDDYPKVEDEEAAQLVGFAIDKISAVITMLLKEVQKL